MTKLTSKDLIQLSQITSLSKSQWRDFNVMIGDLARRGYLESIWVQELRNAFSARPLDINKIALFGGYITLKCCEDLCRLSGINPSFRDLAKNAEVELKYPFRIVNILLDNHLIDLTQANYAAGLLIEHNHASKDLRIDPKNVIANVGVMYIFVDKAYQKINEPLLPE